MQTKIDEIIINKRIRYDLGDLASLAKSLDNHGQLNPITITPQKELIAGQRRLEAAKLLGWETINVSIISNLDAKGKLEIEIDENRFRKQLTNEELEKALENLEKLNKQSGWKKFWSSIKKFFSKLFSKSNNK